MASDNTISREQYDQLRWRQERLFQLDLARELMNAGLLVDYTPDWMFRLAMASLRRQRRKDRDWPSRGVPDLRFPDVRNRVLRLWELKTDTGRVASDQQKWGDALQQCERVEYRIVRPKDYPGILQGITSNRR
jgi:hypothetical protein